MPKRKKAEMFAPRGQKNYWHPYSLQILSPAKFTSVVGKILDGNYQLIVSRYDNRLSSGYFH